MALQTQLEQELIIMVEFGIGVTLQETQQL
jgi:hypothetical protein